MNELDKVIDKLLSNIEAAAQCSDSESVSFYSTVYQRIASVLKNEAVKKQWDVVFVLASELNTAITDGDDVDIENYTKAIQRILSVQCS
jgi:hypothetical protein